MKLRTVTILGIPLLRSKGICTEFNIVSAGNMRALGKSFAHVAGDLHESGKKQVRIGLKASPGAGKSTFVSGLIEPFGDMEVIEKACDVRSQHVWRRGNGAYVRHYDTRVTGCDALKSYWKNRVGELDGPCLDIVEHASLDRHNKEYDCLIEITPKKRLKIYSPDYCEINDLTDRNVTLTVTGEVAKSEAYSKFIGETAHLRARSNENDTGSCAANGTEIAPRCGP